MKTVALAALFIVSFAAALVTATALTGNLSKEGIARLVKGAPEVTAAPTEPADDLGPLTRALRAREEELAKREAAVKQREERVSQMEADLGQLRTEILEIQQQIQQAIDGEETNREKRVTEVATSLSAMKPDKAAKALDGWPDIADAADVLRRIKDRDRGKILDAMEPEKAALLLRKLQERAY